MCNRAKVEAEVDRIVNRFLKLLAGKRQFKLFDFTGSAEFNGYEHPLMPVITNEIPDEVQLFHWGLLPPWANPKTQERKDIRKMTLNARRETIFDLPAFKHIVNNRCIVIVDGFYEHQWADASDPKSKKTKYFIHQTDENPMALAGLWNVNHNFGDPISTFTILTKPAVGLMAEIHNSKLRMPVILDPMFEEEWLMGGDMPDVVPDLVAVKV